MERSRWENLNGRCHPSGSKRRMEPSGWNQDASSMISILYKVATSRFTASLLVYYPHHGTSTLPRRSRGIVWRAACWQMSAAFRNNGVAILSGRVSLISATYRRARVYRTPYYDRLTGARVSGSLLRVTLPRIALCVSCEDFWLFGISSSR